MDTGHWELCCGVPTQDFISKQFGFIYLITNTVTGKKYIGKKQMKTIKKRPPLKGKKNRRCEEIETEWRTYTSSSNEVNSDIEKYGKDKFKFQIILFCDSKWELAYHEARLQFERNVLLREDYYNGIINLRIPKLKYPKDVSTIKYETNDPQS